MVERAVGAEAVPGAPLVLAVELLVLYAAGSYAMGRLVGFSGSGSILGRSAFYLLVFPGVVLHEGAHYLACLITGTKVVRFAPFSPQITPDGRLVLGYVRHERRAFPIRAIIGLAPVILNPLGLLVTTALLTPLTFKEAADPSVGEVVERIFADGYLTDSPLQVVVWAYLSLSFALGSVPSREDLSGLPLLLAMLVAGVLLFESPLIGTEDILSSAAHDLSALAVGLYALPATVAVTGALAMRLLGRPSRW
jgi:hypothetical protein